MSLLRDALLAAAGNAWLRESAMRQRFVRRAVSRFMPGETLDEALGAAGALDRRKIGTIVTHLGENVTSRGETEAVFAHYVDALARIAKTGFDTEVSIKLTQLGLDLDPALARDATARLADLARAQHARLWIDMEASEYAERTVALYRELKPRHPNLGLAIQAYLHRTAADVEALVPLGAAIRLVKGAYKEPASIAFVERERIDASYLELAKRLLRADARAAGVWLTLGTHDPRIIAAVESHVTAGDVPREAFEFALLFGIRRDEPARLVQAGYRCRVLISYGTHWFPWYMRRLAEKPSNLAFVFRSFLGS